MYLCSTVGPNTFQHIVKTIFIVKRKRYVCVIIYLFK